MKGSNILLLLVGAGVLYYLFQQKDKEPTENIDPNDVTKWDDAKLDKYLVEACEVKKKGITTGTHEKPALLESAKKEAIKRGLSIPKCVLSSMDNIDQSFNCPKCGQPTCRCKPLGISDMVNQNNQTATGAMPKCGPGTKFINGRCLPFSIGKPIRIKQGRFQGVKEVKDAKTAMKQIPPSDSYAFPKYIDPQGEGYTLQNA